MLYKKIYRKLFEEDEYRGAHKAPDKISGKPLYDLTDVYPDDIYSSKGAYYYGDGHSYDNESVAIIKEFRGKPNKQLKIYRAVPDFNKKINDKIKYLKNILSYYIKYNFFPVDNDYIFELRKLYDSLKYDEQQTTMFKHIQDEINNLELKKEKSDLKINSGDWVSINKKYAVEHGKSIFNKEYKIIQKIVKAKDIYTNGDSIHEWGYDP